MAPRAKRLSRKVAPGERVHHVIAGFPGRGKTVKRIIAANKEASLLKNAPRLVPKAANRSRADGYYDIIGGYGGGIAANLAGADPQDSDDSEGVDALIDVIPGRQRNNDVESRRLAENWQKTEESIVGLLLHQPLTECGCIGVQSVNVRHIGLTTYQEKVIHYCHCGRSAAMLVDSGYFPSRPIKPGTVFSMELLELLHEQFIRGAVSKYGWGEGLRSFLERKHTIRIPCFRKLLQQAYHHFVSTRSTFDTRIAQFIERNDQQINKKTVWQPESLQNLCPACFGFGVCGTDIDRSITVTLDGNLQHSRFKDRTIWRIDDFKPKLFVEYGRRDYSLAETTSDDSPCGSQFKATNGWNRTERATLTKKALDESGLLAAVCFHGIPLRLLNMHGSGERHSHAYHILKAIVSELESDGSWAVSENLEDHERQDVRVCYDVACVFEAAIWRLMAEYKERLSVRIGRFHVFAHGINCHVNYGTLRTEGYGLTVGEEPESFWSIISPQVKPGRVSSSAERSQNLQSCTFQDAQRKRENLGLNILKRWRKKHELMTKAQSALERVLGQEVAARRDKTGQSHSTQRISLEYLQAQIQDQKEYYRTYKQVDLYIAIHLRSYGLM